MKKTYITPITAYMAATADEVLTIASGVYSEDEGIEYGGIDEDGTKVPGARRHQDLWYDEEEGGEEF